MKKKLKCIMLVDDDPDDNFIHHRVIKKSEAADFVIIKQTALEALGYLQLKQDDSEAHPDLIFLDINMPGMNGWEFLMEYDKMNQQSEIKAIVVLLTTSNNPDDMNKAKSFDRVADFKTKPLTRVMLEEIIDKYF